MSKARNVLVLLADHARHDAVACNADPKASCSLARVVRTPNLDRLAAEGVSFRNSYTTNPICVPARASIITGNYPHRCTGTKGNGGTIGPDQVKMADLFGRSGYITCAIGKLHYLPYSPPGRPRLLHGFQVAELWEEGRMLARFDPAGASQGLEDYHDYLKGVGWGGYERAHGAGNNDVHPTVSPLPAEHYADAWVAERGVVFLRDHLSRGPDQPFLLLASFAKPHPPYDPPRPWDSMYDPRTIPPPLGGWGSEGLLEGRDVELRRRLKIYGWDRLSPEAVQLARACYCALMSFQDEMIGRLLGCLDELGIADSTAVLYTSDHGDLLGDLGRFFKASMFDAAAKVPLIWRVPGVIPRDGPRTRDQLAGLHDILPTLCALTEVALPKPVDGEDVSPILRDPDTAGRQEFLCQTGDSPCQKYMVRTPEWKYVYCELGGTEELYDTSRADYELHNLAGNPRYEEVRARLRQRLLQWCAEHEDQQMIRGGRLAASSVDALPEPEFNAGAMGWRRY